MPVHTRKNLNNAKTLVEQSQAILVVTGAGMSVDSGVPTYRGSGGIWTRSIQVGDECYSYDEISSLKMWKTNPHLAWGFKASFYHTMNTLEPHEGYSILLNAVQNKGEYFICTSNVDGYFERAGFDTSRIYEVHGTIQKNQCTDKRCNIRNGVTDAVIPEIDPDSLLAKKLPVCSFCGNMTRPNVSMFGDYEFFEEPAKHQRKRLNVWLDKVNREQKQLVIIEIGCGVNRHSLRMSNGKMMSGEWKMPLLENHLGTIRINPEQNTDDPNTIHINMGAKAGLRALFSR